MEQLVKFVQDEFITKKELPKFSAGDTITVFYEIKEGEKSRTQFFKGVVLQLRGAGATKTFTIRKMSGNIGVERIFPMNLPTIQKIEVNKLGAVRRKRIFYFRELTGKKARIKEARRK
jgi:large subunit ribosomal protein L19